MPFWKRSPAKAPNKAIATPAQNRTNSRFLQLPGEIRLRIYTFIIFPKLDCLNIAHGTCPLSFNETVLSPSIFRASHQLRAEALSYLCTKKPLQFCEIETANALFQCIGSDAIGDLKSLSIAQTLAQHKPLSRKEIDLFFHFLQQANSLQYFELTTGFLGQNSDADMDVEDVVGKDMVLFERTLEFVKGRDELIFHWAVGTSDSQLALGERIGRLKQRIRALLEGKYENSEKPMMYLW